MIKNLSKVRFILFLTVAAFLVVVIFVQFIVLSVLRGQEQALNNQLEDINIQIEQIPKDVTQEDKKDHARWDLGYVYDDEIIYVEK